MAKNPEQTGFLLGFLIAFSYQFAGMQTEKALRAMGMGGFFVLLAAALVFTVQYKANNAFGGWSSWGAFWTILPAIWIGSWIFNDYILEHFFPAEEERRKRQKEIQDK